MSARERRRKRRRLAAGAGLGIGAALGASATAEAADFTVSNLNDSGAGSLRQALLDANAAPGADRVLFQSTLSGTITLTSGNQLPITDAVQVLGPGADRLAVSGNNSTRILYVVPPTPGVPVTISGLTLRDGRTTSSGGGILNGSATLTVERSVISGNAAGSGDPGGGIYAGQGSLTVISSSITGNSAYRGAGIDSLQSGPYPVTIENSTISANHATLLGGGVSFQDPFNFGAPLTIRSSTISGNRSDSGTYGGGGLFQNKGTVSLDNTIVADNTAPARPDVTTYNPSFPVSATFSLIENPADAKITGGPNITGQDPKLGPLADNGGPTPTEALLEGSPAIDQGQASGADQRGAPRPFDFAGVALAGDNEADIGAYERVLCAGRVVNRVGTAGNDTLTGTAGPDGILGLGGKDTLKGLGAGDGLCGGDGKDKLKGGAGKDKLLGQNGKDKLKGGKGNDVLKGGKGKDKLKGGPGKDKEKQ